LVGVRHAVVVLHASASYAAHFEPPNLRQHQEWEHHAVVVVRASASSTISKDLIEDRIRWGCVVLLWWCIRVHHRRFVSVLPTRMHETCLVDPTSSVKPYKFSSTLLV
jgi:hypothetical protein